MLFTLDLLLLFEYTILIMIKNDWQDNLMHFDEPHDLSKLTADVAPLLTLKEGLVDENLITEDDYFGFGLDRIDETWELDSLVITADYVRGNEGEFLDVID